MNKYHVTIMCCYDEVAVMAVWADTVEEAIAKAESTMCESWEHVGFIQQV